MINLYSLIHIGDSLNSFRNIQIYFGVIKMINGFSKVCITLCLGDVVQNVGTIGPNSNMKYPLEVNAMKLGKYAIVAGLSSDKVELVSGEHELVKWG